MRNIHVAEGCGARMSLEPGAANIGSLVWPLEIDDVLLPVCPSWDEGSAAISEPSSFLAAPTQE